MVNISKRDNRCLICKEKTARIGYKYCSNACQIEYQYKIYIQKWKEGRVGGVQPSLGIVSRHVKNYLRKKFGDKCCLCGWSRTNIKTGKVPLVADHIDGDWRNNIEDNLRLICPNCDAIGPTYAGLNRGRGRKSRTLSKIDDEH